MSEERSIKELGDTQKCPKCQNFADIMAIKVSEKTTRILYRCIKCVKNFQQDYTNEEFIKMANGFLIDDDKWIKMWQQKYMIAGLEYVRLKGGLDGAYFAENKSAVQKHGSSLICKCGDFFKTEFKGFKKDKLYFNMICPNNKCGKKKLKLKKKEWNALSKAGVIPLEIITEVKDYIETAQMDWDTDESYATPATILSSDARSRLGMEEIEDDALEGYTCKKCGAAISIEMKKFGKCPTCGSPLD